jgi:hypothetical protein
MGRQVAKSTGWHGPDRRGHKSNGKSNGKAAGTDRT